MSYQQFSVLAVFATRAEMKVSGGQSHTADCRSHGGVRCFGSAAARNTKQRLVMSYITSLCRNERVGHFHTPLSRRRNDARDAQRVNIKVAEDFYETFKHRYRCLLETCLLFVTFFKRLLEGQSISGLGVRRQSISVLGVRIFKGVMEETMSSH